MHASPIRPDTLPCAGLFVGDDTERFDLAQATAELELPVETCFFVGEQVHGDTVVVIDELPAPAPGEVTIAKSCDALISLQSPVAIAVRTADCLPVLIRDTQTGARAAVHAGWRGTAAGIIEKTIKILKTHGSDPTDLQVWIGPAIQSCCFAVQEDVAQHFPDFTKEEGGETKVFLPAAGVGQLVAAGMPAGNVEISPVCTCCNPRMLPSHRRQGPDRTQVCWSVITH